MRLVLACPPKFTNSREISERIKRYFPSLITTYDLVESKALVGVFKAEKIVETAQRIAQPNWESDIVFMALSGPIYTCEELLLENCGATLQQFRLGAERSLPRVPKFGGYFNLPGIRRLGLSEDVRFLSKLAAEEILHMFDVPEGHDPLCFSHPEVRLSKASHEYEYCQKCLRLMGSLAEPLNHEEIYRFVDELFGWRPSPRSGDEFAPGSVDMADYQGTH